MTTRLWRTFALGAVLLASLAQARQPAVSAPAQRITKSGTVAAIAGPTASFTGRVRVDPLTAANESINASTAYVTFEPGARSAWHTHPQGQYLVVTAGAGLTQEWGKPLQQLSAGDVVWCPPGVKHWHGAAPTTALTHIAITGNQGGKSVQWEEKVGDEQYQSR
ncbi:Cupin domain protein [Duganella sp. CF517]|uniref:(R)-mandelonitrile lyase n=1 Tax=Duganella sp. CF517 TaxID=1881038 RepID=UPI0008CD2D40|nr:cupin domain-containing protein [Duganella sp. CF517]SEN82752.1 Cupin domain protein [Duganella sp. CF517]